MVTCAINYLRVPKHELLRHIDDNLCQIMCAWARWQDSLIGSRSNCESIIILSQRGRAQREKPHNLFPHTKIYIFFQIGKIKRFSKKKMENIQEKKIKIENIVDNPSLQSLFTNGKFEFFPQIKI